MEGFKELTPAALKKFISETEIGYNTTQNKLCFAILKRMYRRIKLGYINLGAIKICEIKGIVVDGNHRYIAYLLAKQKIEFVPWTSAPNDIAVSYKEITIDELEDWDINLAENKKYIEDEDFIAFYKNNNKA